MVCEKITTNDVCAPEFFPFLENKKNNISERSIKKFWDMSRKFIVRYRQDDGLEVSPSTMINYIRSFNRTLKLNEYDLDLLTNSILTYSRERLVAVLDNQFEKQNSEGAVVKHHNTLPRGDIIKVLVHAVCIPNTPSDMSIG